MAQKQYINMDQGEKTQVRICSKCKQEISREELERNFSVCPHCQAYLRIHAKKRIRMMADMGSFEEWDNKLPFANPMGFEGYEDKIQKLKSVHRLDEAIITGKMTLGGIPTAIGVMDSRFLMASMGHNVGEKVTLLFERATKQKLPVILFCCSGGARMQEGIISLMQMAKTSAAVKAHSDAGLLYVSVLTEPTTGGVTASFAMLADITLAEPKAMIGFAGPRVIEQTIGQKLPAGFQRSEFLLQHGFVDAIVRREEMKDKLTQLLALHQLSQKRLLPGLFGGKKLETVRSRVATVDDTTENQMSAWERVKTARMKERPCGVDYIHELFEGFMEFHGDRYFKDDPAIVGGIAWFHGEPVTVIVQQKGKATIEESMTRNFGMPSPDGYRKVLRLMKQAEKFHRTVILMVDTAGAFCGMEAEERGQGEAIARNLYEMSAIQTPVLSIVIGEGGSGGALAMGVGDEVWMLQNAVYSVLSPEGFATILWKDGSRAEEAAGKMKITAQDLYDLKVIERIIEEREPVTVENMEDVCAQLEQGLVEFINQYSRYSEARLAANKYKRFRQF